MLFPRGCQRRKQFCTRTVTPFCLVGVVLRFKTNTTLLQLIVSCQFHFSWTTVLTEVCSFISKNKCVGWQFYEIEESSLMISDDKPTSTFRTYVQCNSTLLPIYASSLVELVAAAAVVHTTLYRLLSGINLLLLPLLTACSCHHYHQPSPPIPPIPLYTKVHSICRNHRVLRAPAVWEAAGLYLL